MLKDNLQDVVDKTPSQVTGRSRSDLLEHTEKRRLLGLEHACGADLRRSGVRISRRKWEGTEQRKTTGALWGWTNREKLPVWCGMCSEN